MSLEQRGRTRPCLTRGVLWSPSLAPRGPQVAPQGLALACFPLTLHKSTCFYSVSVMKNDTDTGSMQKEAMSATVYRCVLEDTVLSTS